MELTQVPKTQFVGENGLNKSVSAVLLRMVRMLVWTACAPGGENAGVDSLCSAGWLRAGLCAGCRSR